VKQCSPLLLLQTVSLEEEEEEEEEQEGQSHFEGKHYNIFVNMCLYPIPFINIQSHQ